MYQKSNSCYTYLIFIYDMTALVIITYLIYISKLYASEIYSIGVGARYKKILEKRLHMFLCIH